MITRIPYKQYPNLWGEVDYAAVLNVQIARSERNAPRSKRFEAIVDSGASGCNFHASIGRAVGLDIESGQPRETMGISGKPTKVFLHEITMYVPGGSVIIPAVFSDELPVAGLLGMRGFFEHFKVAFDPVGKVCELERVYHA